MAGRKTELTYAEIIQNNCKLAPIKWWPKCAYHYTDISNAVNILASGYLYNRINAQEERVMANDNASIQVINMTESAATSNVRFYFRPQTPTQYFNEGFKHEGIRYCGDANANVPVPVFFLFDLEKLLIEPATKFSEFSQAGHGSEILTGLENFSDLDFRKIYSTGPVDESERRYRHAELLFPNAYQIDKSLNYILCRNEIERSTLMSLLKRKDFRTYKKYRDIIKIGKNNMFLYNGLHLQDVSFGPNSIIYAFADTYAKSYYERTQMRRQGIDSLSPISGEFNFKWSDRKDTIIYEKSLVKKIDYLTPGKIIFNQIPEYKDAKQITITFSIEGKLISFIERPLGDHILGDLISL